MRDPKDFLGRGWSFPLLESDSDVGMVTADEDVKQSIRLILETEPGERVMRPDFGCPLRRYLFDSITTGTMGVIGHRVEQALIEWEPRIDVRDVTVTAPNAAAGVLEIGVSYVVRSTNTFYNLVYPFYLHEGGGP